MELELTIWPVNVTYAAILTVTGNLLSDNGSGADTDPDSNPLSIVETSVTSQAGRTVTLASNGQFSYTASEDLIGFDTFTYTLSDGNGLTDTATVTITIAAPSGAIVGTAGGNTQTGTSGNDILIGLAGNDTINGNAGNDTGYGGGGLDTFNGGDGDDSFFGGFGNDTMNGGIGTDSALFGLAGSNFIIYRDNSAYITVKDISNTDTGYGTDKVYNDVEFVVFGDQTVDLTTTTFTLNGEGWGTNTYTMATNTSSYSGYAARDVIYGNAISNTISGLYGNDDLYGGGGQDTLNGGDGDDLLSGELGNDTLNGGAGTDSAVFAVSSTGFIVYRDNSGYLTVRDTGDTTITGQGVDKVYNDVESIVFNDVTLDLTAMTFALNGEGWGTAATFTGGAGGETITGYGARDIIYGGSGTGQDVIYGRAGNDDLYGEGGNDTLHGEDGNDLLVGGDGNDTINGGNGNDALYGGAGTDTMSGGAGADSFIFEAASAYSNIDTISDFNTSQGDKLNLGNLLNLYDPLTEAITDFVELTTSGSNTLVKVDRDGTDSAYGWTQISTLTGVTGLTDEAALVANGNLIVA